MAVKDNATALGRDFSFKDVLVSRGEDTLCLENSRLRRVFDLRSGMPVTVSLMDKRSGVECADRAKQNADFGFMGFASPTDDRPTEYVVDSVTVEQVPSSVLCSEHVLVRVHIQERLQGLEYLREYTLYPALAVIAARAAIRSQATPNIFWTARGGLRRNEREAVSFRESCVDSLTFAFPATELRTVEFFGRTDYTNHQVDEKDHPTDGEDL